MTFPQGVYGPEELAQLTEALNEVAKARGLDADSLERGWLTRSLIDALDKGDLEHLEKTIQSLKRHKAQSLVL